MAELTLEALAKRIEALEQKLAERSAPGKLDWLNVVGICEDNEFTRSMFAEMEAYREAERRAALDEADQSTLIDEPPSAASNSTP